MSKLIFTLLLLTPFLCYGEEGLVLKDTHFSFDWSDASCRIQMHRKKERDKKLREYYHAKGYSGLDKRLSASAIFISMFTDFEINSAPKVVVTNVWNVSSEFVKVYNTSPEHLFLEISGNGVWWRERKSRFPSDIMFFLDEEKNELVTTHKIFHSDFCLTDYETRLSWTTVRDLNNPTVEELLYFLLKD